MTDAPPETGTPVRRWHQALSFAILGRVEPELGEHIRPEPAVLAAELAGAQQGGREGLRAEIAGRRASGLGWPYVVPDELRAGLGAAQFAAAFGELCRLLDLDGGLRRIVSGRPPDQAEQALLREVPPHHGG
jgi:hypothetical protein